MASGLGITRRISGGAAVRCIRWFYCERRQVFLRENMTQDNANHDAAPAATAVSTDDRTDKAAPSQCRDRPGDTPVSDRPKPINDARLAALEELSALDQELELQHGLTGNPMIKARERTLPTQSTPGDCSLPGECIPPVYP